MQVNKQRQITTICPLLEPIMVTIQANTGACTNVRGPEASRLCWINK